ncbi:carbohydrate ABC transporter membrane protein 1, CUT1 family (TC 3.A.1.1.-) [Paenibacillus sp. yr247]|uniref:ABC transporter permease n=1 Tax=Paenibacillus sp. yr247 TaxID=1761880 RepID=UPI00087F501A|nr:ABC transporter permease subunit [Paenibacillus sp. yr247]SDO35363.1 carbohydrate ABC transporter membrane protein 1, CUT1 family (TC 3.A.1.1.-) [Paenibacillus sp. yr247]
MVNPDLASLKKRTLRHWQLYLIVLLPTIFLITFNYVPMLGIQLAFKEFSPVKGIWGSPWVGGKQFNMFFTSPFFWPVIRNTLLLSVYSLLIGTPAAIFLALAMNEVPSQRFKKVVQMITYAPYFISTVVLVGIINIVLSPSTGIYGQFAHLFGIEQAYDILGQPKAFPSLYVWSGVWQETGYGAVIYLASLANINPEMHEASKIDGASRLQRIINIDLPAIRPTIIVLLILSVGGLLSVGFEKVFLLQNMLNLDASEVISTYVYKIGLVNTNYSFAVAVGLFNSIVGFILIFTTNLLAKKYSDSSLF